MVDFLFFDIIIYINYTIIERIILIYFIFNRLTQALNINFNNCTNNFVHENAFFHLCFYLKLSFFSTKFTKKILSVSSPLCTYFWLFLENFSTYLIRWPIGALAKTEFKISDIWSKVLLFVSPWIYLILNIFNVCNI